MDDDDLMIEEFKIEASEMFENAEEGILNIDKGHDFSSNFNSIFRSFHSLKGAAGMFGMDALQGHMHKLESLFEAQKKYGGMKKHQIDYFLNGIDAARSLLDGRKVNFSHIDLECFNEEKNDLSTVPIISCKIEDTESMYCIEEFLAKNNGVAFVLDSERDIVENLSRILEGSGIVVHKFYEEKIFLNAFESVRPDVVIANLVMSNLNGLEVLEAIRNFSTDTPVIFISSNITNEFMRDAFRCGAYAFIEIPYDDIKVLSICSNAIKKNKSLTLLEKSIDYILYQFSSLDQYLKDQGKENVRLNLKNELQSILEQKKILKNL